jgi:hypothetical protein
MEEDSGSGELKDEGKTYGGLRDGGCERDGQKRYSGQNGKLHCGGSVRFDSELRV